MFYSITYSHPAFNTWIKTSQENFLYPSRWANRLWCLRTLWCSHLPSVFSPVCPSLCWSSRAQSPLPRSRSTRRGATGCSTQSHLLPSYRSWSSSRSAQWTHTHTHTQQGCERAGRWAGYFPGFIMKTFSNPSVFKVLTQSGLEITTVFCLLHFNQNNLHFNL